MMQKSSTAGWKIRRVPITENYLPTVLRCSVGAIFIRWQTASPGKCPLFLCIRQPGGEIVFIETHDTYFVAPSLELQKAVNELFGQEIYYARVGHDPAGKAETCVGAEDGDGDGGKVMEFIPMHLAAAGRPPGK